MTETETSSVSTPCGVSVRPEFEPRSGVYRVNHDADGSWPVSTTLVLAIGSLTGDDPKGMLPLNRAVDPDVLEHHVGTRTRGAELSFEFHGYRVTVRDDGRIDLLPLDERGT